MTPQNIRQILVLDSCWFPSKYKNLSSPYRLTLADEFCIKSLLRDIHVKLRGLGVLKETALRPIQDIPRNLKEEARCHALLDTLSYDVGFFACNVV